MFVVAYGKYLLKAAQQVYSTTQRERDIKFIIFKRTYFVESFQREPNSLWSTFDHQLHNFATNEISTDEHTFPRNKQDRDEPRYDIFILRECSYNELKLFQLKRTGMLICVQSRTWRDLTNFVSSDVLHVLF